MSHAQDITAHAAILLGLLQDPESTPKVPDASLDKNQNATGFEPLLLQNLLVT